MITQFPRQLWMASRVGSQLRRTCVVFFGVLVAFWLALPTSSARDAALPSVDHLVPCDQTFTDSESKLFAYLQLSKAKLFVTPGDMARFLYLPGIGGKETAVSIFRDGNRKGALPGGCWLALTQASRLLWTFALHPADDSGTLQSVTVERKVVPLPESTAQAVREAWLAMLMHSRQPSHPDPTIDSSFEIYSAMSRSGRVLSACSPSRPGTNPSGLLNLTNKLIEYAYLKAPERLQKLDQVERSALELANRAGRATKAER